MPYRSDAKKAADYRYIEKNREKINAAAAARYYEKTRGTFRAIGAQLPRPEADTIAQAAKAARVPIAAMIRAAAYRLAHDPGAADAIRADAAAWRADFAANPPPAPRPDNTPARKETRGRPRKDTGKPLATGQDGQKDTGPENSPKD